MDLLKFLDILIGLAIVMVLMSPLVTAITQFILWITRSRSRALLRGLRDLILQLDTSPLGEFDRAEVTIIGAVGSTRARIGKGRYLPTDAKGKGVVQLEKLSATSPDEILIAVENGTHAAVVLWPRASGNDCMIQSPASDATGSTEVEYNFVGPEGYASWKANVEVLDPGANRVAAKIDWTITGGPDTGSGVLTVSAANPAEFEYPKRNVPASYALQLTISNSAGQPLSDYKAAFNFLRNSEHDVSLVQAQLVNHKTILPLPSWAKTRLLPDEANAVAMAILLHPMIAGPEIWLTGKHTMGSVVEREELIRILLEFAANEGSGAGRLSPQQRTALQQVLARNGIPFPASTLAKIRTLAQEREKTNPSTAAHDRQSQAILEGAQSDFVGKINNWFDQTMSRTTQRYAMAARCWTVLSALAVAVFMQFDSLDLLKRLSGDDKLRGSLLAEADAQQKRLNSNADPSERDAAKTKRDEIEANLAKLRSPQLAVLPDRFLWNTESMARLERNATWSLPFPSRFELVVGEQRYAITPEPKTDIIEGLRLGITRSGAPVTASIEAGDRNAELIVTGDGTQDLKITDGDKITNLLATDDKVANTRLVYNDEWPAAISLPTAQLMLGKTGPGSAPIGIPVSGTKRDIMEKIRAAVSQKAPNVSVTNFPSAVVVFTSRDPDIEWIELRWNPTRPSTNILHNTRFTPRQGRLYQSTFDNYRKANVHASLVLSGTQICGGSAGDCASVTLDDIHNNLRGGESALESTVRRPDALVIHSHRSGPIELRSEPGNPDTNVLNRYIESVHNWSLVQEGQDFRGILVSWVLLSLGAPFWYDALKDLLKLRPVLAGKEEKQREDRQNDQTTDSTKNPAKEKKS